MKKNREYFENFRCGVVARIARKMALSIFRLLVSVIVGRESANMRSDGADEDRS